MNLTVYLWIAFLIIFILAVYYYCWCKRFHREIAEENGVQARSRTNSDHDFSYWANGWPVSYPDSSDHHEHDHHQYHQYDRHGCGTTDSYQNSNHNNECHINFGHHYLCESELPK